MVLTELQFEKCISRISLLNMIKESSINDLWSDLDDELFACKQFVADTFSFN